MYQKTTIPLHAASSEAASSRQRNLTLADIQSDSISKLVQKHLGKSVEWDPKVVETIMETELVPSGYSSQKLMLLEFSQYLEKYLWPFFDQNASLNHVISICLIVNEKSRQHVSLWDAFDDTDKFSNLFQRVIHLLLDGELSMSLQCSLLVFVIQSFQSLENQLVCTESLKLVTIGIWSELAHESRREGILDEYPSLRKLWNSANKKLATAGRERERERERERV
ncbi:hypothetical protein K501DRAFT_98706 [Backusella circina FSU 941]|nr:hypothetical protein K501DRAFT_98706 [Backusella circina FSU 941]